jgi:hypothetical protein
LGLDDDDNDDDKDNDGVCVKSHVVDTLRATKTTKHTSGAKTKKHKFGSIFSGANSFWDESRREGTDSWRTTVICTFFYMQINDSQLFRICVSFKRHFRELSVLLVCMYP